MEESLLKWVRETIGDLGVVPTDFKYGFRDGLAFAALVHKYDPTLLDFHSVSKDDPVALLTQSFELAEKHMNIPQLLTPADLTEGDPDERSVQLYVSLMFHAFTSKREKEEMEAANKGIASRLEDLGTRLKREAEEREELLKQKDSLLAAQAGIESTLDERAKQVALLAEAVKKSQDDLAHLRAQLEELHELKKRDLEYSSKMAQLRELEERQRTGSTNEAEEAAALKEEIQRRKAEIDNLRERLGGMGEEEVQALDAQLAATQEELAKETQRLKAQIEQENQAKHLREQKAVRLRDERDVLAKKLSHSSKASAGMYGHVFVNRLYSHLTFLSTAWSLLSKNLEEHLEDLYCWREVQADGESDPTKRIDIKAIVPSISSTKNWEQQATLLVDRLEDENKNLLKVLDVKVSILIISILIAPTCSMT